MSVGFPSARLAVRGVEKRWGDAVGLRAVTFDVEAGAMVAVRGRSGSGKSTLLAVLAGWCRPDGGEVLFDGAVVDLAAQPWTRVAVVPQVLALVNELTVRENVALALADTLPARRLDDVLVALDLVDIERRFPEEVSMGQQQRAAVGRAIVGSPVLVLADEPTSHQDRDHAIAVVAALRDAGRQGSAVVVASHDPAVVESADHVIDLDV